LPRQVINTRALAACPSCNDLLRVDAYPALVRSQPAARPGERLQLDQESACFYHPQKKAVVPCSACGRFLCALCDVQVNDQHLCPTCLEIGKTQGKIKNLENHRICYDTIALLVATVSLFLHTLAVFTAPLVIFLTVKYWNAPTSIIPRTKIRFIAAFAMAVVQLVIWIAVFANLFSALQS
jgi:hypothetical protein